MKTLLKEGFEVEYCTHLPVGPTGALVDQATFIHEEFESYEEAITRAKEVLLLDQFGAVGVQKFERIERTKFMPPRFEYVGDREEITE